MTALHWLVIWFAVRYWREMVVAVIVAVILLLLWRSVPDIEDR